MFSPRQRPTTWVTTIAALVLPLGHFTPSFAQAPDAPPQVTGGNGGDPSQAAPAVPEDAIHEAFMERSTAGQRTETVPGEPPAPVQEPIQEADKPRPEAVWVPGYWHWSKVQSDWVWIPGIWRVPPTGREWVQGRFERTPNGTIWVSGFWSSVKPERVVYVQTPPPPPRQEVVYVSPGPDYMWVRGYWFWDGRGYVWIQGHWTLAPADRIYVESHWEWQPRGYVFVAGYWDEPIVRRGVVYAPIYAGPRSSINLDLSIAIGHPHRLDYGVVNNVYLERQVRVNNVRNINITKQYNVNRVQNVNIDRNVNINRDRNVTVNRDRNVNIDRNATVNRPAGRGDGGRMPRTGADLPGLAHDARPGRPFESPRDGRAPRGLDPSSRPRRGGDLLDSLRSGSGRDHDDRDKDRRRRRDD